MWHSSDFAAALRSSAGFQESSLSSLEFVEEIEVFNAFAC
jgi:hypothetical protein